MSHARRNKNARRQRGAALVILAAIIVLSVSWMVISAYGNAARNTSGDIAHNARVLKEARAALVAWVATNALDTTEDNPGRLPCPQAWGDIGTTNEGRAAGNCSAPAAGLLPWRTLGLPKTLDASGQQLWYVVSPGWHLPNATTNLTINSNTAGQLALDGQANAAVALIIAPGRPLTINPNSNQSAAGCTARTQTQALGGGELSPLNFLECHNASTADYSFVTSVVDNSANAVFNDQVLAVTTADVLPPLEAIIAKRIERDIVPSLSQVYATSTWSLNTTNPVFPYAALFTNPSASSFQGTLGTYEGLLPFNQIHNCTGDRCLPDLIDWQGTPANAVETLNWGSIESQDCGFQSDRALFNCRGVYRESGSQPSQPIRIEMTATFKNVAMGLRALDATKMTVEARDYNSGDDECRGAWEAQTVTSTAVINSGTQIGKPAGSATITVGAIVPNINAKGWGSTACFRIRIYRDIVTDHALLSATAATTGWFVRNEWFRQVYYATASAHAANALAPRSCTDAGVPTCLQISNVTPANKQRAILILAGRYLPSINTGANTAVPYYLEEPNATLTSSPRFAQKTVGPSFNDRIVVVDANTP